MLWLFVLSSKAFLNMFYTDMSGLAAQEWGQKERTQVLSLFFFFCPRPCAVSPACHVTN